MKENKETNIKVFRSDVQILRGFAVLAVLLYHANNDFFQNGYLGVDIFFVISGFVVTPMILRVCEQTDGKNLEFRKKLFLFFKRRFKRLFPALSITVLSTIVLAILFISPTDHSRIADQGIASILGISNMTADSTAGNYFDPAPNPLLHTWSLSVEQQIYVIVPFLIYLALKFTFIRSIRVVYILVAVTSLAINLKIIPNETIFLNFINFEVSDYYSSLARFWQFSLGGLVFLILPRNKFEHKSKIFTGVFLLIFFIVVFSPVSIDPTLLQILVTFLTCIVVLYRIIDLKIKYLKNILIWCGDNSYSIYLVHMPFMVIAKHSTVLNFNRENRHFETILALIFTFIFGNLLHTFVENKFYTNSLFHLNGKTKSLFLILFIILPILTLILFKYSTSNNFWGYNKNIVIPKNAINFDRFCSNGTKLEFLCVYNYENGNQKKVHLTFTQLTKNSNKLILLIGDSHAGQLKEVINTVAQQKRLVFTSRILPNCSFDIVESSQSKKSSECAEFNAKTLGLIKELKPEIVVLSQYVNSESNVSQMFSSLKRLQMETKHLVLVRNIPIFPDFDYMVPSPIFFEPYNPPKSIMVSKMNVEGEIKMNQIVSLAKDFGIKVKDFRGLFCDSKYCHRYADGNWLYSDTEHLSIFGARLTIPSFINLVDSLS